MDRCIIRRLILITPLLAIFVGCLERNLPTATPIQSGQTTASVFPTNTPISTTTFLPIFPGTAIGQISTRETGTTPTSTQPEIAQILDMQFIDSAHGWLLAATYNGNWGIAIRQTADGGQTWTSVAAPQAQPAFGMESSTRNADQVHNIRFVDEKTGWIYGQGLYYTQDGGNIWHPVDFTGAVVALEPEGTDQATWAIIQTCPQIPDCTAQLYQAAPDEPDLWTLISTLPIQHPLLAFNRADPETAYLLSNAGSQDFRVNLVTTQDAGHSWAIRETPCFSEQPLLANTDTSNLYMVCSGIPSAGNQPKQFYTSTDGGEAWRLVEYSNNETALPTFGYADALVFLSNKVGVVGLGRSTLVTTQDGGLSWTMSSIPNMADSGGWVLVIAGGRDIFAALQTTVFNSSDGGKTWQSTEIH